MSVLVSGLLVLAVLISADSAAGDEGGRAVPELSKTVENPKAESLLKSLDKWLAGVRDISADFRQKYRHPLKDEASEAAGRIEVKKPGMIKIEYSRPEKRILILNREEFISYEPGLRQMFRGSAGNVVEPVFFSFLGEDQPLRHKYMSRLLVTAAGEAGEKAIHVLELVPLKPSDAFSRLLVSFHFKPLCILRLVAVEHSGALNSFTLSRVKINTGLLNFRFKFKRPPGVREVPVTPMPDR